MANTDERTRFTWMALGFTAALLSGAAFITSQFYSPFEMEITRVPASPLTPARTLEDTTPPGGVDVAQVEVGQSYYFRGLRPSEITVWTVKEITPTEVRYEEGRLQNGELESLGIFLFPRRDWTSDLEKVGQERIEVEGASFDCGIYETGGMKTWSAKAFPGTIRTMSGDRVVRALVRIEQG